MKISMKNKKMLSNVTLLVFLCAFLATSGCTGISKGPETKAQRDKRMEWWQDARFGLFIHWGIYSVPAGEYGDRTDHAEWIMHSAKIPIPEYEQYAAQFNPVKFNADQWVKAAKDAGMKYIVITSKHHDGFSIWDSAVSDYNIVDATPFKRDILKELAEACRKQKMTLCFYHSIMDWHHPDAKGENFADYRENYLKPQLAELVNNYGPLGVLWFDGEWIKEWTEPQGKDLYKYVRDLQPNIIINNRVGKGRQGMGGMSKSKDFAGDFGTPEQEIPAGGLPGVDWESCMTMNRYWGHNKADTQWKSTETLIHNLVDIASKGGNYLLNVGPTSQGVFPDESITRLKEIGDWMAVNSQSIYDTQANTLGELSWGRCTVKGKKLYLHVFDWPTDAKLKVPCVSKKVKKAYLLADKRTKLAVDRIDANNIVVDLPSNAVDEIDTVIVLELK